MTAPRATRRTKEPATHLVSEEIFRQVYDWAYAREAMLRVLEQMQASEGR
jgi:hypothetical protein